MASDLPQNADFQKTSDELSDGLKSCRMMLNDYRALLTGESAVSGPTLDGMAPGDQSSAMEGWRTQEDSNL